MKRVLLSLLTIALAFSTAEAAKWRVNNRTGVDADFTDIGSAVTAASPGDTIYVEPSASYYSGGINITKPLVIIGSGYFNGNSVYGTYPTNNPGLQADTVGSQIYGSYLSLNTGSAGSVIMGLTFNQCYPVVYDNNITIKRNLLYYTALYISDNYGSITGLNNLDIRQNLFVSTSVTSSAFYGAFSNIGIQNNLFYSSSISLPVGATGAVQNNNFVSGSINCWGFQINNNIMTESSSFTANNCVFFNNIGDATQFPNSGNGSNNQQNITTTALYTNYSSGTESRFALAPAGPGIGAGFNGVDCGIFGGPDPYKLSGIPPFPTIYSLSAPNTTTSATLPVTISTRSND